MSKLKSKLRKQKEISKRIYENGSKNKLLSMIRKFDDPALSQKCIEVNSVIDGMIQNDIRNMTNVLLATKDGVGLAASQIGVMKRILVYRDGIKSRNVYVIVNPEILESAKESVFYKESCLSYPGVVVNTSRPRWIKIKYQDEKGLFHTRVFDGFIGRVIMHEIDHLNGICIVGDSYRDNKMVVKPELITQETIEEKQN